MKPGFAQIENLFLIRSFPQYWILQSECYEIWKIDSAGDLEGVKRGDILTVIGTAGSYTFQVPDTAAYIALDTDNIWFRTDETPRIAIEAEMVGYDFARTIIKYLDVAPYSIDYIMILSDDFATAIENKMRDNFHLSMWWNGIDSGHGYDKGNRSEECSLWLVDAPSDPVLTIFGGNSIKFDFQDNSTGESGFYIERSTTDESNYTVVHTNGAGITTWTDNTVSVLTKYYYRVRGYITGSGGSGYSAYCVSVNATTPASYDDASVALFARKLTADGVAYTDLRKAALDTYIKGLKTDGIFDTKFDNLVLIKGIGVNGHYLNIIKDATNATGTANHVDDVGDNSDGSSTYINTNFNPTTNGVNYIANDAFWLFKISGNQGSGTKLHGLYSTVFSYLGKYTGAAFHGTGEFGAYSAIIGYNCLRQYVLGGLNKVELMQNFITTGPIGNWPILPNDNYFQLACDVSGSPNYYSDTAEILEVIGHGGSGFTQADFLNFQTRTETLFANY